MMSEAWCAVPEQEGCRERSDDHPKVLTLCGISLERSKLGTEREPHEMFHPMDKISVHTFS